jgi:hypothetical protein
MMNLFSELGIEDRLQVWLPSIESLSGVLGGAAGKEGSNAALPTY